MWVSLKKSVPVSSSYSLSNVPPEIRSRIATVTSPPFGVRAQVHHVALDSHVTRSGPESPSAGYSELCEVLDEGAGCTVEALDLRIRGLDDVVLIGGVRAAPVAEAE